MALPPGASRALPIGAILPLLERASLLPRDATGRIWLLQQDGTRVRWWRLDPRTGAAEPLPAVENADGSFRVLAWPDGNHALVQLGSSIERIDVRSGPRTQLFPRKP